MAKVEIDEAELASLHNIRKFADTALASPKTRRQMLEIDKTLNPDKVIPEIDAAAGVRQEMKSVEDRLNTFMTKLEARDAKVEEDRATTAAQRRVTEGQGFLRQQGYTAEAVTKIEELMVADGIASYAAAALYFDKLNPPAIPAASTRTSRFNDLSGSDIQSDDFKPLWESQGADNNWLDNQIRKIQHEFRN